MGSYLRDSLLELPQCTLTFRLGSTNVMLDIGLLIRGIEKSSY
jgi:hypothetical protein